MINYYNVILNLNYQSERKSYGDFESFKTAKDIFFKILNEVINFNANHYNEIDPGEYLELRAVLQDDLFNDIETIELIHVNTYILTKDAFYLNDIKDLERQSLKDILTRKKGSLSNNQRQLIKLLLDDKNEAKEGRTYIELKINNGGNSYE